MQRNLKAPFHESYVSTWTLGKLTKCIMVHNGVVMASGEGDNDRQAMADMLGSFGSLLYFAQEACKRGL